FTLRSAGELEVEVLREPCGARRPREHHPQHVCALVLVDERAERKEVGRSARRIPVCDVTGWLLRGGPEPRVCLANVLLEPEEVVTRGLHAHEQTVERCDVDANRVVPRLEVLDECRARPGKGIEDPPTRLHVPGQQRLHELRHELPQVRVEPVNVLRPLTLREFLLRPGEVEIFGELVVERCLCRRHAGSFDSTAPGPWSYSSGTR